MLLKWIFFPQPSNEAHSKLYTKFIPPIQRSSPDSDSWLHVRQCLYPTQEGTVRGCIFIYPLHYGSVRLGLYLHVVAHLERSR